MFARAVGFFTNIPTAIYNIPSAIQGYFREEPKPKPGTRNATKQELIHMLQKSIPGARLIVLNNRGEVEELLPIEEEVKADQPDAKKVAAGNGAPTVPEAKIDWNETRAMAIRNVDKARALMDSSADLAYHAAQTACQLDTKLGLSEARLLLAEAAIKSKNKRFGIEAFNQLTDFIQLHQRTLDDLLSDANVAYDKQNGLKHYEKMTAWNALSETLSKCHLFQAVIMRLEGNLAEINKILLAFFTIEITRASHADINKRFQRDLDAKSRLRNGMRKDTLDFIQILDEAEIKADEPERKKEATKEEEEQKQAAKRQKEQRKLKSFTSLAIKEQTKHIEEMNKQKKFAEARHLLTLAIREQPEQDYFYFLRGIVYLEKGKLDRALLNLNYALWINLTNPHTEFHGRYLEARSRTYIRMGDYQGGKTDLQNILNKLDEFKAKPQIAKKINQHSYDVFNLKFSIELLEKANSLIRKNQHQEAIFYLEESEKHCPKEFKKVEMILDHLKELIEAWSKIKTKAIQYKHLPQQKIIALQQIKVSLEKKLKPQPDSKKIPGPSKTKMRKQQEKDEQRQAARLKFAELKAATKVEQDKQKRQKSAAAKIKQQLHAAQIAQDEKKAAEKQAAEDSRSKQLFDEFERLHAKDKKIQADAKAAKDARLKREADRAKIKDQEAKAISEQKEKARQDNLQQARKLKQQKAEQQRQQQQQQDDNLKQAIEAAKQAPAIDAKADQAIDKMIDEIILDQVIEERNKYRTQLSINLRPFEKTMLVTLNHFPQEAKIVGSRVWRELLDGTINPNKDVDFVATNSPEEVKALKVQGLFFNNTEHRPQLFRCENPKLDLEISDEMKKSLEQCAMPRNFTICTLFADESGFIHAPYKIALQHLREGIIAVLPHTTPKKSFEDDPLRILQAIALLNEQVRGKPFRFQETMEETIRGWEFKLVEDAKNTSCAGRFNHYFTTKIFNDKANLSYFLKNLIQLDVFKKLFSPLSEDNIIKNTDDLIQILVQSENLPLHEIYMHFIVCSGIRTFDECERVIKENLLFRCQFERMRMREDPKSLFDRVNDQWQAIHATKAPTPATVRMPRPVPYFSASPVTTHVAAFGTFANGVQHEQPNGASHGKARRTLTPKQKAKRKARREAELVLQQAQQQPQPPAPQFAYNGKKS